MNVRLLWAALCLATTAHADALHPLFRDGQWRHEFSGWLFPAQVGTLARVGTPYSIDGNDDAAGAVYGDAELLVVEVFGSGSADPRASVAGAGAAVAASHPRLRATTAQPFAIPGLARLASQRIDYLSDGPGAAASPRLYFISNGEWSVSILATGFRDLATADSLVRTLPWGSLGSPERLH